LAAKNMAFRIPRYLRNWIQSNNLLLAALQTSGVKDSFLNRNKNT